MDSRARRTNRQRVRRRRRRSGDLRLARRARGKRAAFPARFSRRENDPSRTELPFDREYLASSERDHREQSAASWQKTVDRRRRWHSDRALRRVQRTGRSAFRHRTYPRISARRRRSHRVRHSLSLERAIAKFRRTAHPARHPLPRLRRTAILRPRRNQGRARVFTSRRESSRRSRIRTRRQHTDARHRRTHARRAAPTRAPRKRRDVGLPRCRNSPAANSPDAQRVR